MQNDPKYTHGCLYCMYTHVVADSDGNYHSVCTKCESPEFMQRVNIAYDGCEYGSKED